MAIDPPRGARSVKASTIARPNGRPPATRRNNPSRGMEKVVHLAFKLFHNHLFSLYAILRWTDMSSRWFSAKLRHVINLLRNHTAPDPNRIRPEHLNNSYVQMFRSDPISFLMYTFVRFFARCLLECKVPSQRKTGRILLLYNQGDDIGNSRSIFLQD